jgi:hypothetical protein
VVAARPTKPADDKTTEDKISEAPKATVKPEEKAAESYIDKAAELAGDVRALAEGMREALAEVEERCAKVNETAPEADAYAAVDGVRRISMATGDVHRALEGLAHVAAELATKAQRTE